MIDTGVEKNYFTGIYFIHLAKFFLGIKAPYNTTLLREVAPHILQ